MKKNKHDKVAVTINPTFSEKKETGETYIAGLMIFHRNKYQTFLFSSPKWSRYRKKKKGKEKKPWELKTNKQKNPQGTWL